ncbi:hypothetical protein [Curtobacterium sp. MCBA15_001]|uniref:hypothetical protein n=1 Tax=Curtobacterium sp. MCBA15_001 TaxID=1898731 RepID=UPI0008DE1891|nr:hypothetical protein [Curtobacterium sp. MCBA15_001]OIH95130.1 hypothetical protein BIU90_03065 [Curtobacterium sp. MCBA15_001]
MTESGRPRDRDARRLAERALAALLHAAADHSTELVLIGGLVPEYLVDADEPHQGTNDVDLLLDIGLEYDRDDDDHGWLERALDRAGFVPASPNVGWRWVADVDGYPVVVEFLSDVSDNLDQEIALPGTTTLTVKNLRGPGPALRDAHVASVLGERVRMADIGGYVAAKGAAAYWRRADKDLYDFAWVLVNASRADPGRAAAAVAAVLDPAVDRDRWGAVLGVCSLFDTAMSDGTATFVTTALAAGSAQDAEELALDAVLAVRLFRAALEPRAQD